MSKKISNNTKLAFIYVRYLLPIALCILLIGVMLIPSLSYTTMGEISLAELVENSWNQARQYLFSKSDSEAMSENFYKTVIVLIPILIVMFAIGIASVIATAVGALMYINSHEFRRSNGRIWFITIVPNRIVMCMLHALVLPLLFYSRIIILLYGKLLGVNVSLKTSFPEAWIFGILFIAVIIAMSIISCEFEKDMGIDLFKKTATPAVKIIDNYEEPKTVANFFTESERVQYEQRQRAKQEQEELIRRLLNKNDKEEN